MHSVALARPITWYAQIKRLGEIKTGIFANKP